MIKTTAKTENKNAVYLVFETKSGTEKSLAIQTSHQTISEPYVSVKIILSSNGAFVEFKHKHLQTLIDLSNLSNLLVLGFDANLKFVGVSLVGKKANAPFQILSQSKYILVQPNNTNLDLTQLKKLSLTSSKKSAESSKKGTS